MGDTTLYNATQPTEGTLANAHEKILRMKRGGVFQNITGDINNLKPTPTPITQARENYGQKGTPSVEKLGDSWVVTFDTEVIRNPTTKEIAAAQAWLVDLLVIANSKGSLNKADFQWFDALATSIPAHEGTFSVAAVETTVGYAEKAGYTFTLTSDGVVDDITSPIAGTGVPIIESASPSGATASAGKNVVVRGYNLDTVTGATIGGVAATLVTLIDRYTVVLEVPAGSAGSAPIILTNTAGASASFPFTRGA